MTPQRLRSQRGMTLVELLVGTVVTSIVLIGVTGVLYTVTGRYQTWVDRVNTASTGLGLAAAIQADSHRFVICHATNTGSDHELDLCVPGEGTATVVYRISGGSAPWIVSRQEGTASPTFMARGLGPTRPHFWVDCFQISLGVSSGHIHIYDLRLDKRSTESYSVYYRAPRKCP